MNKIQQIEEVVRENIEVSTIDDRILVTIASQPNEQGFYSKSTYNLHNIICKEKN